jgi:hypothetical protein
MGYQRSGTRLHTRVGRLLSSNHSLLKKKKRRLAGSQVLQKKKKKVKVSTNSLDDCPEHISVSAFLGRQCPIEAYVVRNMFRPPEWEVKDIPDYLRDIIGGHDIDVHAIKPRAQLDIPRVRFPKIYSDLREIVDEGRRHICVLRIGVDLEVERIRVISV